MTDISMNDLYGDGSLHIACKECGCCIDCGDCTKHHNWKQNLKPKDSIPIPSEDKPLFFTEHFHKNLKKTPEEERADYVG